MDFLILHGPTITYIGIVIFLVLTGGGLPIPEEVPIVAAGVLSSSANGDPFLNRYIAFACCLVGALLGDLLVYSIGRFLGKNFFRRHPRFAHFLHEEREKQMEDLIRRHGLKVFLIARFMVGIRAPVYLAAGVLRVPFRRFIIVDAFCATLVVSVVFWLSYRYGHVIGDLIRQSQWRFTVAILAVVLGVVLIWYMRHRRTAQEAADENETADEAVSPNETDASDKRIAV